MKTKSKVEANAENKESEIVKKQANSTIKKAKAALKSSNGTHKSPMLNQKKAKDDNQPAKTDKQNAKIDTPQVKNDEAKKKRWKANKHKRNLLHTLVKLTAENNLQRMKEQLPAIENEIQNLYSKTLSKSASRRLRMLEGYEKKIKSGSMSASKKVKAKSSTKVSK